MDAQDRSRRPWIVAVSLDRDVAIPEGGVVSQEDFHAWLWDRAAGLLGIDEGSVTVADAAAGGLVPERLVVDVAAAPPERDWVAELAGADVEWWFSDEAAARDAMGLVAGLRGCRVRGVRADPPVDHEAVSRAAFSPIVVPGFGVVKPAWEAGVAGFAGAGGALIFIEPGPGFGTGLHETTQLCLAALADRRHRGGRFDRVLDFGSGSGILAIAAAVLGARRVDAVEIDTRVHDALRANASRNAVAARLSLTADLAGEAGGYDLVVANIVAAVLVERAADLCDRVARRGGELVLSGLLAADLPAVADRYAALLGAPPLVRERGDWRCLSFRRE